MNRHTGDDWSEDRWTESDEKFKKAIDEIKEKNPEFWEIPEAQCQQSFAATLTKKKPARHHTMLKVACILLIFFIAVTGTAIWINSEPASALKFQIQQKYYQLKNGLFSTENSDSADSEDSIVVKYTSMEDIPKAKRFLPELYVPEYIPDGYELSLLEVMKKADGGYEVCYQFLGTEEKYLIINMTNKARDDYEPMVFAEGTMLEVEGLEIALWKDSITETYGSSVIVSNVVVHVTGTISENEMIEIIKYIQ